MYFFILSRNYTPIKKILIHPKAFELTVFDKIQFNPCEFSIYFGEQKNFPYLRLGGNWVTKNFHTRPTGQRRFWFAWIFL
jgi:hypothetical protein